MTLYKHRLPMIQKHNLSTLFSHLPASDHLLLITTRRITDGFREVQLQNFKASKLQSFKTWKLQSFNTSELQNFKTSSQTQSNKDAIAG